MQLTNQQILSLADAITHLDGQHVTQVVEGKAVAIFRSYKLAHAARWLLAQAQGKLQTAIVDFNRAKDALIKHHSDGTGSISPASPKFGAFSEEFEKLKQQAVDLPLEQIALDHLKLAENEQAGHELPIAVLSALTPLIKTL